MEDYWKDRIFNIEDELPLLDRKVVLTFHENFPRKGYHDYLAGRLININRQDVKFEDEPHGYVFKLIDGSIYLYTCFEQWAYYPQRQDDEIWHSFNCKLPAPDRNVFLSHWRDDFKDGLRPVFIGIVGNEVVETDALDGCPEGWAATHWASMPFEKKNDPAFFSFKEEGCPYRNYRFGYDCGIETIQEREERFAAEVKAAEERKAKREAKKAQKTKEP